MSTQNPTVADRPTEQYQLPSGEIVNIFADTSRGASVITYQLKGGRIVDAVLVGPRICEFCGSSKPVGQSCICFDNGCQ